jgi:hypothetical protein
MQRRYTNFDELSLARVLGEGVRSQHEITEPLPQRWLDLLTELDKLLTTEAPPTQPKQGVDGDAHHEDTATTEPDSLMKQLAQLEMRTQADMDRERWCAAVDRAVAELVSMGCMAPRTTKP